MSTCERRKECMAKEKKDRMDFSFLLLIIIISATAFYCCFLPCMDLVCRSIAKCIHNRRQMGVPEAEANYENDSESRCSDTSVIEIPSNHVVIIDEDWDSEERGRRWEDVINNEGLEEGHKPSSNGDEENKNLPDIIIPRAKSVRQSSERQRERRLQYGQSGIGASSYDSDDDSVSSDNSQVPTAYPRLQVTPYCSNDRRHIGRVYPMQEEEEQKENDENV